MLKLICTDEIDPAYYAICQLRMKLGASLLSCLAAYVLNLSEFCMSDFMKRTIACLGAVLWLLVLNELDVLRGLTEFVSYVLHF